MTPRNKNIIIGVVATIGIFLLGRYYWKKSKTPDKLTLDVTNVDDIGKTFSYVVKKEDGSILTQGDFNVMDLDKMEVLGKNKFTITTDFTKNHAIVQAESLGQRQFYKKVKFKSPNDITQLGQTLTAVTTPQG